MPNNFWEDLQPADTVQPPSNPPPAKGSPFWEDLKPEVEVKFTQPDLTGRSPEQLALGVEHQKNLEYENPSFMQSAGRMAEGFTQGIGDLVQGTGHLLGQGYEAVKSIIPANLQQPGGPEQAGKAWGELGTSVSNMGPADVIAALSEDVGNFAFGNPETSGRALGRNLPFLAAPELANAAKGITRAPEAIGRGAGAASERLVASELKLNKSERSFGREPAKTVAREVEPANSLEGWQANVQDRIKQANTELDAMLNDPKAATKRIKLDTMFDAIDEVAESAKGMKGGYNKALAERINQWAADLKNDLRQQFTTTTEAGGARFRSEINLTPAEANQVRKDIAASVTSWTEDAVEQGLNEAKVEAYREVRSLVERQVPGSRKQLSLVSDLISADKALERRVNAAQNKSIMGPLDVLTTLAGETAGHMAGLPFGLSGITAEVLMKGMGSVAFKSRLAKILSKMAPEEVTKWANSMPPEAKSALRTMMREGVQGGAIGEVGERTAGEIQGKYGTSMGGYTSNEYAKGSLQWTNYALDEIETRPNSAIDMSEISAQNAGQTAFTDSTGRAVGLVDVHKINNEGRQVLRVNNVAIDPDLKGLARGKILRKIIDEIKGYNLPVEVGGGISQEAAAMVEKYLNSKEGSMEAMKRYGTQGGSEGPGTFSEQGFQFTPEELNELNQIPVPKSTAAKPVTGGRFSEEEFVFPAEEKLTASKAKLKKK